MNIDIKNTYSTVTGIESSEEIALLRLCTSINIRYYSKQKGARHGEWKNQAVNYFDESLKTFPSGLLPRVVNYLRRHGIDVHIIDSREKPDGVGVDINLTLPPLPTTDANYDFQNKAVDDAITAGRGLLHYPTGAGKTIIIARIIDKIKRPSLIIVPNLTLLNQTYNKYLQLFGDDVVGKWGESQFINPDAPIMVATQQSLWSCFKNQSDIFYHRVSKYDVLFVDECHHIATGSNWERNKETGVWQLKENPANTWWNVAMEIDCYYRFGMSATLNMPDSPNNQFVLETVSGRVISSISVGELIESKVLCPAEVNMIKIDLPRYGIWKTRYRWEKGDDGKLHKIGIREPGAYEYNIIQNEERNQHIINIAERAYAEGRRVLILVDLVETHGKVLKRLLGDKAVFLHGGKNKKEREEGLQVVKEDGKILLGTIFKEGFDMPAIDTLIIAGGGKSMKATVQKIGRVLRVSPGKFVAEVYDFYDADNSMCEAHSKARLDIYQGEDRYKVNIIEDKYKITA